MKNDVINFLKKYGMYHDSINLDASCKEFILEMEKGLEGKDSSLLMLPTYLSTDDEVRVNEPVIVMDAGGTNFRVAVVHFGEDKKPVVEDFKLYPMPGTYGVISKEEFFDTIVKYLEPVIHTSNIIGFCFSYPTEILPDKDGRLIEFTKEVAVKDVEGAIIGAGISEALKRHGIAEPKRFILLNDTVATMLGGIMAYPDFNFDSYIGFIFGTGTNTCYIESSSNITKCNVSNLPASMAINMESGGYDKFPRGKMDIDFDNATVNPGEHTYEKMVSGAYQGGVIFLTIKKAIKDGLFSADFSSKFSQLEQVTMRNIDDFCFYPYGDNVLANCADSDDDKNTLYYILDESFERAAKMVCVNISAIMLKTGKGKSPIKPVCVAAEGTTFYKSKLFKGKLDYYIKQYTNEQLGLYCQFIKAENATLIGTAVAGLLNG